MKKNVKIGGYNFELFTGFTGMGRGRQKKKLTEFDKELITHLKKSGVTDKRISDFTKLNLSRCYINQKFRIRKEVEICKKIK